MAMSWIEKWQCRRLGRKWEKQKKFLLQYSHVMPSGYKKFLSAYYPDAAVRKKYSEEIGVEFGEGSWVNAGFIKIPNTNSAERVVIGRNVSVGPNLVCICEANANNGKEINTYPYVANRATRKGDIIIEDDVWIGANVTIMPGITIGKCSIVGAGSVVTKNLEPYGVYAGVPAKKIRNVRDDWNDNR